MNGIAEMQPQSEYIANIIVNCVCSLSIIEIKVIEYDYNYTMIWKMEFPPVCCKITSKNPK